MRDSNSVPRLNTLLICDKIRLSEAQNWRCADCGKRMDLDAQDENDRPTFEHLISLSAGGTDTLDNIAILCRACNKLEDKKTRTWPITKKLKRAFKRAGDGNYIRGLERLVESQSTELRELRRRVLRFDDELASERKKVKRIQEDIEKVAADRKSIRNELSSLRGRLMRFVSDEDTRA